MLPLRYGSICSGIEAVSVALEPLGWLPQFFSEIDRFPSALLAHRYPNVPNLGDFTKIEEGQHNAIDVLFAGTPCQDFSLAGLRAGMVGARGNLTLEFGRFARRARARWLVWENVPGVLSNNEGRDFGNFLGLLSGQVITPPPTGWQNAGIVEGIGNAYGLAWRVLDAQFVRVDGFGRAVPQRRRRVFVVGYLGDWRRAAAVLLERASLQGFAAPRRGTGQNVAGAVNASAGRRGGTDDPERNHYVPEILGQALTAKIAKGSSGPSGDEHHHLIAFDQVQVTRPDNCSRNDIGDPSPSLHSSPPAVAFTSKGSGKDASEQVAPTLRTAGPAVAFTCKDSGQDASEQVAPTLRSMAEIDGHANGGGQIAVAYGIGFGSDPLISEEFSQPLTLRHGDPGCVAFKAAAFTRNKGGGNPDTVAPALLGDADRGDQDTLVLAPDVATPVLGGEGDTGGHRGASVDSSSSLIGERAHVWRVRRLTPLECERLQGFPDNYTNFPGYNPRKRSAGASSSTKGVADGPRYRALGNSMAVNVMRWIARRIEMVEAFITEGDTK